MSLQPLNRKHSYLNHRYPVGSMPGGGARGQNLEHLQKAVFLCWSLIEVYIFATIHSWTKGTLPKHTPPTQPHPTPTQPHPNSPNTTPPYPTLPYPSYATLHVHLPLLYPYPTPTHTLLPYPTLPYPTPPTLHLPQPLPYPYHNP